jgi:hypothetical protein
MLTWRGFYLGPDGALRDPQGPTFTTRTGEAEAKCVSAAEGARDADSACFLAKIARIPADAALYLGLETGCTAAYFTAWVAAVQARGFIPGVAGTPEAIAGLGELGIDLAHWVFRATKLEVTEDGVRTVEQWVH